MRKILVTILLLSGFMQLRAQHIEPLNTPLYWLRDARAKANAKDSAGTFNSLQNAVKFGLFDTGAIKSKAYTSLLLSEQSSELHAGIIDNRRKIEKPSSIQIVTADIDRFWKEFTHRNDSSFNKQFFRNYILKGSVGLKTFYQIRMNSNLDDFIEKMRTIPDYYKSIQKVSLQFGKMRPQFVDAAQKLEELYPESIFPPIYFLMGYLNNVGTADGYAGLLIGTEHLCKFSNTDTSQLSPIDKMVIFDTSLVVPLIVHEYVHFQQKNKAEETLMELAIMEGVADFITYLITGRYTNPDVYRYGFENEAAVWKQFQKEMLTTNTDNWLFNVYNPDTGYPGNLGYFVGFRICESYYNGAPDKKQAIRNMLNIRDFNVLLKDAAYVGK